MKKYLFAFVLAVLTVAGCKKDDSVKPQFEGSQWITDELDVAPMPKHQLLWDFGFTKPGVAYEALVIAEDDGGYSEGDIVKVFEDSYSYDASTGKLTIGSDDLKVSFVNNDMIKIEFAPDDIMIFNRAKKKYNLKDAIDPPEEPEEFSITPDKTAEWAGGTVKINATGDVAKWSFELVYPEGTSESDKLKYYASYDTETSISDSGELTLACYMKRLVANISDRVNMDIKVIAESESGEKAECLVTSKYWQIRVTSENSNVALEPSEVICGGTYCFIIDDADENVYKGFADDGDFIWKSNCIYPFAHSGGYVYADILYRNQIDESAPYHISVTYGTYTSRFVIPEENIWAR